MNDSARASSPRPATFHRSVRLLLVLTCLAGLVSLAGCQRTESVQTGFRGTGMEQVYDPVRVAAAGPLHSIPPPEPVDEPDPEAPSIAEVHENVQVLNDLTVLEFARLMQAMSTWVAPEEGCEYCHNPENLASDEKYTKVAARRMLQMTRDLNTNWKSHVAETGVTCWTCHRGQAVPSGDWFAKPVVDPSAKPLGYQAGQNTAGMATVGGASLPYDPLTRYLNQDNAIRVQGTKALAGNGGPSVKQAESTYGLMIYMSQSLGVNCSYCHNTRALANWNESSPARSTAWYGIRMVRELNVDYLTPLTPIWPSHRLSAEGDGPKVGCQTCHKGAFKPLYGVTMLNDYPELRGVYKDRPAPTPSVVATNAPP